jgi:hypothetical protein
MAPPAGVPLLLIFLFTFASGVANKWIFSIASAHQFDIKIDDHTKLKNYSFR